ncbi:hypothetical protein ACL1IM_14645, partial [Corynebacterium striatum]
CLDGATYSAIAAALGCSRRDIAKVKTLIADHGITKESFAQLDDARRYLVPVGRYRVPTGADIGYRG